MGILGNLIKTAIQVGASAIPVVGPIAGPAVGAAMQGGKSGGLLGRVAQAGADIGASKIGQKLQGQHSGPMSFGAGGGQGPISSSASAANVGSRVAENVVQGATGDAFHPSMVARNPIGLIASGQVMTGAERIPDMMKMLGGF